MSEDNDIKKQINDTKLLKSQLAIVNFGDEPTNSQSFDD